MDDPTQPADARSRRDDPVSTIAVLGEPTRRRLYEYVAASGGAVGRDEAAAALGIGRELAAFHLEQLAAAGLVETEFRRLSGRSGPGAGRPAKLYRRSSQEVSVSLPARDYERVAEVFADALDQLVASDEGVARAVETTIGDIARTQGRQYGTAARKQAGSRAGAARRRTELVKALDAAGYEPRTDVAEHRIRLQNCPFHALSASHRDLTCGMNLAWANGVLETLGGARLEAELAPEPGSCCVTFHEAHRAP
jgi:predicted ArsR family transcriptional regulator